MNKALQYLLASTLAATSAYATADDFGVELVWNTTDAEEVLKVLPEQKDEFHKLVKKGEIKDMFLVKSNIDGKPAQLLKFVITGDSEKEVTEKLHRLPMYEKELVKIHKIQNLGAKWLDNTPVYNNYGVTFTWKEEIEPLEIDRVLGIDLQRVISLNQAGLVTSAYINTQKMSNGVERPIYSVAFLAKDAQHARELSKQFESVNLGYASIDVQYLGHKVNITD
ncbi:hypothetical protein ACQEXU_10125 [Vibrio sp. TRT 21S02]|uniref:hypothetical protein n=1 Tax=unclassified Vibrio TaxID=2614977 RepID=UPI003CEF7436